MKKRHLNKLSNMNNLRRSSRRGSLAINFFNESGSRRRSNASSTGGHRISKDFGSSRRITGEKDHSSDLGSDMSRDQSRTWDDNFTKSIMHPEEEQSVVQELEDEDNVSDILSNK